MTGSSPIPRPILVAADVVLLVAGEGGIVDTNNDDLAEHVRVGREFGNAGDYGSDFPGRNARLPEFNGILGLRSLELLEENTLRRNRVAAALRERLGRIRGLTFQRIRQKDRSSYQDFFVLVDEMAFGLTRDELALALKAENDEIASKSLSLPIWSHMDQETVAGICEAIERIHHYAEQVRGALAVRGSKALPINSRPIGG